MFSVNGEYSFLLMERLRSRGILPGALQSNVQVWLLALPLFPPCASKKWE